MDNIKFRSFTSEIRKKNEETRTVTFIASDGSRDSAHTVLNQEGWDLERFNKNPIIGYNHNIYGSWKPEHRAPDHAVRAVLVEAHREAAGG